MGVSPHGRFAPKTLRPTDDVNINNQQRPGSIRRLPVVASLNINLFIQPGRQGRSQDFSTEAKEIRPEAGKRFSRILSVHSGLSSRSVPVECFSYMTRPYQTRAKNCYQTRPNYQGGVPLEVGTDASGKKTRIMGLPDCQNSFKIRLTVLTVYITQQRRVTDRHVHRRTYTLRLSVCLTSVCRVHRA